MVPLILRIPTWASTNRSKYSLSAHHASVTLHMTILSQRWPKPRICQWRVLQEYQNYLLNSLMLWWIHPTCPWSAMCSRLHMSDALPQASIKMLFIKAVNDQDDKCISATSLVVYVGIINKFMAKGMICHDFDAVRFFYIPGHQTDVILDLASHSLRENPN